MVWEEKIETQRPQGFAGVNNTVDKGEKMTAQGINFKGTIFCLYKIGM